MSRGEEELYNLEIFISQMLRGGVLIAGALLLVGWLTQIQFHENPFLAFQVYQPLSLKLYLNQLWQGGEWGLLTACGGLFVLISLPILRVVMTAVLFLRQGERKLALVAAFVLVLLLMSFSLGIEI